jgi:hypothetical protein
MQMALMARMQMALMARMQMALMTRMQMALQMNLRDSRRAPPWPWPARRAAAQHTAMQKWRIVMLGYGTGDKRMGIE